MKLPNVVQPTMLVTVIQIQVIVKVVQNFIVKEAICNGHWRRQRQGTSANENVSVTTVVVTNMTDNAADERDSHAEEV